jgi:hypothetical protein
VLLHAYRRLRGKFKIAFVIINNREKDCAYWIIQKLGSSDIVDWGTTSDFSSAQAQAQQHLESLVRHYPERRG